MSDKEKLAAMDAAIARLASASPEAEATLRAEEERLAEKAKREVSQVDSHPIIRRLSFAEALAIAKAADANESE